MHFVIDNFLPEVEQEIMKNMITHCPHTMSFGTVFKGYRDNLPFVDSLKDDYDLIQFESKIIEYGKIVIPNENLFNDIWSMFIANNIEEHIKKIRNRDDYHLRRMKCNFLPQKFTLWHKSHTPHVDVDDNFTIVNDLPKDTNAVSAIYYVNCTDGPTVLYNEKENDNPKKLTVYKKITPKQGRLLVFDSQRYHTSTSPIRHKHRQVINMIFY